LKTGKRTRITVKKREVLVVRKLRNAETAWCAACAEMVPLASVEQAAALAATSMRKIFQRIEEQSLHSAETPDGRLLVCLNSLLI
jgi:hypothetical protein